MSGSSSCDGQISVGQPGEDADRADGWCREGPTVIVELAGHPRERRAEPLLLLAPIGDPELAPDEGGKAVERVEDARCALDPQDLRLATARAEELCQLGQRGQRNAVHPV